MRFSILSAVVSVAVLVFPSSTLSTTDAFTPKHSSPWVASTKNARTTTDMNGQGQQQKATLLLHQATGSATIAEVETKPIAGMKPGTSGLRKKVEVWQAIDDSNANYVENFIQSLLDTAQKNNGGNMLETYVKGRQRRHKWTLADSIWHHSTNFFWASFLFALYWLVGNINFLG